MRKLLASPGKTTLVGLVVSIVGFVTAALLGDLTSLQAATSPEEFAAVANESGNGVRWASWVDILVIVPGYTLLLGGLLLLLARADRSALNGSRLGLRALGGGILFDQIENLCVQLGLGTVNLDQPGPDEVVNPADWLITMMQGAFWLKWLGILGAVAIIVVLGVRHLIRR